MSGTIPRLVLSELTLSAIQAEATRAAIKHPDNWMGGKNTHNDHERLAILMEEVGEVAHELTYDQPGDRDELVKELIQVAAMAASWVEFLEGGHQ
jgi:NTP pyrophosphatase (non-canonical NTP hydrolase)